MAATNIEDVIAAKHFSDTNVNLEQASILPKISRKDSTDAADYFNRR